MRVAILRRSPAETYSMDVYADNLVRGLQKVRPSWDIFELCPAIDQINRDRPAWLVGVQKYQERYWRYPRALKNIDADIFHVIDHFHGYLSYWLQRYDQANVVTCHDLINLVKPETFKGRAIFPLASMAVWQLSVRGMKHADRIISVSSHTKQDIVQHLQIDAEAITVIPNGVDSVFSPISAQDCKAIREKFGASTQTFCLLNVGSNNLRKNVSAILQVLSSLKQKGLPVQFWKVGMDFNADQKAYIRDRNLEANVTYLGFPDQETLVKIYAAADVLVAPSTYEGFGLTVLEAMASGTAVVAANATSLPEVAGDAALLVDPLDIDAIANAVYGLYNDLNLRQQLIHKGLERVQKFTWENTAKQVANIYERVLS